MTINLKMPDIRELKPRITVFGCGGAGGNAVNNMITAGLLGCDFVVANTDAQALTMSKAERIIQMGVAVTEGLGAGSKPEIGAAAAEEAMADIKAHLVGCHMVFITAGMGGGTGTGAAPVIARASREEGILTVGVVTKPFQFEGSRRYRAAEAGIQRYVISVATYLDETQATEQLVTLIDAGYDGSLAAAESNGRVVFTLQVGPFEDLWEAEQAADTLDASYGFESTVALQRREEP